MALDLLYFANPMCSWCYGFGPSLNAIKESFGNAVSISVALGSLREDTEPMRPDQKAYLRQAWTRVGEASGQSFTFDLLDRDDFVYDTRPASRAIAAIRTADASSTLPYLEALQTAFYRDNRDVTHATVLSAIADELGLTSAVVQQALENPTTADALMAEYQQVAQMGVSGYPTLVAMTQPQPQLVTHGFQRPEPIVAAVREAIDKAPAPAA